MNLITPKTITILTDNIGDSDSDNRAEMFDDYITTQTEHADSIQVSVEANKISHFALFNMDAYDVDWWLYDTVSDSSELEGDSIDLELPEAGKVGTVEYKSDILQAVGAWTFSGELDVHINKTGGTAKCGHMLIGNAETLGTTLRLVETGLIDYSYYDTNAFGYTSLTQGNWAKEVKAKILVDTDKIDRVYQALIDARATPVVWDFNESGTDFEPLLIYGWYRDFSIELQYNHAILSLDVKGMI